MDAPTLWPKKPNGTPISGCSARPSLSISALIDVNGGSSRRAARPGNSTAYDLYRAVLQGDPYPVRALVSFGGNMLLANGDSLEGPYIDRAAARRFRPGEHHPTIYRGEEFRWAEHKANWVLERWTVRELGITLLGPDPIPRFART